MKDYSNKLNAYSRNIYIFIQDYEEAQNRNYFSRNELKFFGERLSEMRILKTLEIKKDYNGEKHKCYVLSKFSRNYPGGAKRTYDYFRIDTLERI